MERRLAAIMAADVVGYSRLIRADEEGTLAALKALRADLIDPKLAERNGRIVKLMGDGMLAEFASVVEAVRTAVETQAAVAERNAGLPEDRRIAFRVGVNLGDVVIDGDDIHGDGVNIAARLEGLAEPGGICVSDKVYEEVRDRIDVAFEDLGEQEIKNIDRPVRVWRWLAGDGVAPTEPLGATELQPLPDKPSIAVLPFDNMSGDPEQEYFSDGIVEEITAALSRVRSFFVIARNSAFAYKKKPTDIREIAKELDVRYLLEGSVRRGGNVLRITAQLIRGADGGHIWADTYDGTLDDIFELQDAITSTIVGVIQPKIRNEEIHLSRRKPPSNLQAYDYVMQAFPHTWMLDRTDNQVAIALLGKAMVADPDYALAFALASWCEGQKSVYQWTEDIDVAKQKALSLARKAFSLDPNDPTVLTALSAAQAFAGEMESASENIRRALDIDPNSAWAWSRKGWLHYFDFHFDFNAGVSAFENALRLSPLDPMNFNCFIGLGALQMAGEKYGEAIEFIQRGLRENPDALWAYRPLAICYARQGHKEEAKKCVDILQQEYPDLNIGTIMHANAVQDPAARQRYREGLILAGVPEE